MKEVKALQLTGESFQDYGYVLSETHGNPMGQDEELTYWGKLSHFTVGDVSSGVLYNHKREPVVRKFERHVKTPEVLVALEGDSVICLAKPGCNPNQDSECIKVFYIKQGEAIVMHAGTWHWVPFPTNCEKSKFLVLFAAGTEDHDMDFCELNEEIEIKY